MAARTAEQLAQPASIPLDGFSAFPVVKAFTGGLSRETIRLWEIAGRFPRRIYLTQRSVVWKNSELRRWAENPTAYRAAPDTQNAA